MRSAGLFNLGKGELTIPPNGKQRSENQKVTCGFEEVDSPSEHIEKQGEHMPLYSFRHHSQMRMLMTLWKELQGPEDDAVLQYFDSTVYRSDLQNLREDEWLNDNNITFLFEYLEHVHMSNFENHKSIILLRPSMSYMVQQVPDALSLKEVLPPMDKARYIFLPLNDNPDASVVAGGCHWALLVVDTESSVAYYYDTMEGCNYQVASVTARQLGVMLDKDLQLKTMPTPQQCNVSDCGVLGCELTALLVHRILNDETDMNVDNVTLVASAGRTFMLTTVLQLIQDKRFKPPSNEESDS